MNFGFCPSWMVNYYGISFCPQSWDASPEVSPRGKKSEKSSKSSASSKPKSRYFNIDQARQTFSKRLKSNNYCKLLAKRQELPVYQHRENILQAIRKNNVLVIAGETGSGKSTQIPQFIVEVRSSSINVLLCHVRFLKVSGSIRECVLWFLRWWKHNLSPINHFRRQGGI